MPYEEQELLQLLQNDLEKGLPVVMEQYGQTVYWIIEKILGVGNHEEIEDCMADVFVRLWQHADRFDQRRGTKFASWLYGIARHTALDYKRRICRQGTTIPLEEAELGIALDLEDEMAKKINGEILRQTIAQLPSPDREIFIYRYFCELPIKEIAMLLGLSNKQVENKLYRGKLTLRTKLEEKGMIR